MQMKLLSFNPSKVIPRNIALASHRFYNRLQLVSTNTSWYLKYDDFPNRMDNFSTIFTASVFAVSILLFKFYYSNCVELNQLTIDITNSYWSSTREKKKKQPNVHPALYENLPTLYGFIPFRFRYNREIYQKDVRLVKI